MNFIESYRIAEDAIREFKPDLFFANADRVEMCGATAAAFHNKVKIAHYQAGVVNDPITTFDDIDRHVITLWSDIQFCETRCAALTVNMLRNAVGLPSYPHVVGITHLDDLEVDESKVPRLDGSIFADDFGDYETDAPIEPYDLVLYNTPPFSNKDADHYSIEEILANAGRFVVQIQGNPDGYMRVITTPQNFNYYPNLPRPQFMGLLKNCARFITNSSCATTEAPFFLREDQIIQVGDRNRNRPPVECKPGGSDRIVAILKEYAKRTLRNN